MNLFLMAVILTAVMNDLFMAFTAVSGGTSSKQSCVCTCMLTWNPLEVLLLSRAAWHLHAHLESPGGTSSKQSCVGTSCSPGIPWRHFFKAELHRHLHAHLESPGGTSSKQSCVGICMLTWNLLEALLQSRAA